MAQSDKKSFLISFEGVGAAGKSLQVDMLRRDPDMQKCMSMKIAKGVSRQSMQESLWPFRDRETERLWVTVLPKVHPGTDMLAFIAAMNENCLTMKDELASDQDGKLKVIIFDRYIDTALTHAVARAALAGEHEDGPAIKSLFGTFFALKEHIEWPDLTIVIDTPIEVAEGRAMKRENHGYSETDRKGFKTISEAYRKLASYEPDRVHFIDGRKSPEEILSEIKDLIRNKTGAQWKKDTTA
ncbi:MAG: hypothetical protein LVQ97_05140 [Candidatus Micrarchaeales archaeon]|jgi:hypothetical protein|uniref:Probable thymidylate kinase n=1 Tax=Candidatus Micrarchaeum acidiphilum ARMAN-2 TaxID=425595 RepID=C7DGQ9_MICA2|nr:MAG: Thymidylate kinase-like protein [Candidatus Micrarchaeum acidiphilum ARMAN-2]MCW6161542.1 hypothetical protein [Candidatus Micrarchaeales archaeon]